MKKVVLLGDSIRISYQERVREMLSDIACVVWPEENLGNTLSAIWHVRALFKERGWGTIDLIHWNNGIWDHLRTLDDGAPLTTPEEYLYQNRRLYCQLREYTPHLIWATTTPAGLCYTQDPDSFYPIPREEWNREVKLYNDIVSAFLTAHDVVIDDLYELMSKHIEFIRDDGIHLTENGVEAAANQVAACIRAQLERM